MQNEPISDDMQEWIEHKNAVLAVKRLLLLPEGKALFKYLFKQFEVGKLPPVNFPSELLMDKIGSLRAGQALFELASEAEPAAAATLLAQIEKERYENLQAIHDSGKG